MKILWWMGRRSYWFFPGVEGVEGVGTWLASLVLYPVNYFHFCFAPLFLSSSSSFSSFFFSLFSFFFFFFFFFLFLFLFLLFHCGVSSWLGVMDNFRRSSLFAALSSKLTWCIMVMPYIFMSKWSPQFSQQSSFFVFFDRDEIKVDGIAWFLISNRWIIVWIMINNAIDVV